MRLFTLLQTAFTKIGTLMKRYNDTADYIVEIGTTGIWTYEKWNSGQLKCWGASTASGLAITKTSGYGYYYDNWTVSFPSGLFKTVSYAQLGSFGSAGLVTPSGRDYSASTISARIWGSTSLPSWNGTITIYAVGTWK